MAHYEFQIEARSAEELRETLMAIVAALDFVPAAGRLSFARYPANDGAQIAVPIPIPPAASASEPAETLVPVPKRRGRPPRNTNGSGADGAPTVVENPDGFLAAVTQPMAIVQEEEQQQQPEQPPAKQMEDLDVLASLPPVPEDVPGMSPGDMRERAIALMQQAFGYAQGPDLVRAVHRRLKVRKIADVPDAQCRELLDDATAVLAQLKASGSLIIPTAVGKSA